MTKINETYLCEICGNKVEVAAAGAGQLVCCGQPMKLLKNRATNCQFPPMPKKHPIFFLFQHPIKQDWRSES
ncbi:desulfoferrodoxin FeS4 iron-binding domain-containing protein [Candidatus Bathyarchaeota archaeon]|nr:desulfoferrodoxin FeS4 iron-binding domain-containing protein [Candidatus Bathyarchaeota archaeon]